MDNDKKDKQSYDLISLCPLNIDKINFEEIEEISKSPNGTVSKVVLNDTQENFTMKLLPNLKNSISRENFAKFCIKLSKISYPFSLPISFFYFGLQYAIEQQQKGKPLDGYDEQKKYLILYAISQFLESIHDDQLFYGDLKLSNILLKDDFSPLITDLFLYEIINIFSSLTSADNKFDGSEILLPPEFFTEDPQLTTASDIYSFGIIIIQVLTNQIKIEFEENQISNESKKTTLQSEEYIQPKIIPEIVIPEQIPYQLRKILKLCFSKNPKERPTAKIIKSILENILFSKKIKYDIKKKDQKTTEINENIKILKEKADNGDLQSIFLYGRLRCLGENCTKNMTEGMNYIRVAAKFKVNNAEKFYNYFNKGKSPDKTSLLYIMPDSSNQQQQKIEQTIVDVKKNIDREDIFEFDKKKFSKLNFIPTDKALERLTILKYYIEAGRSVILEGPTGTSKTLSVEIVCKYLKRKLIRINLSSEAKSSNLKGSYVGDSESWAGITMKDGPYITAYKNGYCLLLDEINLANPECLQFIEDTLDSGEISNNLPGKGNQQIKMHEDFRLIATQNPNKDFFSGKRKELSPSFLSRFQVINFPKFERDELLSIALGLAKKFNYKGGNKIIEDLVDFHMKWSKKSDEAEDIQCFTIREITSTVRSLSKFSSNRRCTNKDKADESWFASLSKDEYIFYTIMTIYGARYQKNKKKELEKLLTEYESFKNCKPSKTCFPNLFTNCYPNKSLSDVLVSVFSSFKNHRSVIITAAEGTGLSQIARWIAQYFNQTTEKEFYCLCTEETKCIHLIGNQKPSDRLNSYNNNNELLEWKPGFLMEAIIGGFCAILDNIDQAPPTVSERLNSLLDKTYGENGNKDDSYFEVPENPNQNKVKIDKNFHLLCTCKIDNINNMSPAFINRFDVIVLEDQIDYNEIELKKLISILMKQSNSLIKKEKSDDNSNNTEYTPSDEVINLIYQNVNINDSKKDDTNNDSKQNEDQDAQTNKLTMFYLSQLCRAVEKFTNYFPNDISTDSIVKLAADLLNKTKDFEISPKIEKYLLSQLIDKNERQNVNKKENNFFYQKSPILKSFIAKLFASSLINLPVCIYGPTGVGKTSSAREFAQMRPIKINSKELFYMFSFHAGTKPNYFYGTTTINDKKVQYINGALTISFIDGLTFIADEMNLSSESTMKSLAPALEPINGKSIYISGIDEPVVINPNFFFIVCQNERGTLGRNPIPPSIASRFRYFDYPKQTESDISTICSDIALSFYKKDEEASFTEEQAQTVGKYMICLNDLNKRIIQKWSLRDITKIFLRIHHQDTNPDRFIYEGSSKSNKAMRLYMNLLFYTLSSINNEDIASISKDIFDLMKKVFDYDDTVYNELKQSYESNPSTKVINGKTYLMKRNFGILFDTFDKVKSGLPTLLNGIFQVLLADPTEPILLMGPSGFKTFLSQLFLKSAKIITLNHESTVQQLLGSSAFLTKDESKIFYIEYICKVCHLNKKIMYFIEQYNKYHKTDINKFKVEFEEEVFPQIPLLPKSFEYSIKHLMTKLFDENIDITNHCILSNLELEFRPGLFLWAILERKSLILKDLSNLQTIVLERFNELFSAKMLTLNEDIHNTITNENQKELTDFDLNFRVIATCHPNSLNKLSEAVRSRFTVIFIPSYNQKIEQEIVLNSYIELNKLHFEPQHISKIIDFSKEMNDNLKKNFSFPQIINSIEICSRLNKITEKSNWINNIGIVLYRLGYGLFDNKSNDLKKSFNEIFNKLKIPLNEKIEKSCECDPLMIDSKNGSKGIRSNITNIFYTYPDVKENKEKLAFTPTFSEMVDILINGILLNVPVIFEGMPGQGKQTAINYVSAILGFNVINIILSKTTNVEDLLGKITIEHDDNNDIHVKIIDTKLIKVLKADSEYEKSIIVFHNINNASPAVLAVISTIFDHHQTELLLPDGSTLHKRSINLVGIFNPQNGVFNRDRLPSSLIHSSIYHIVSNPNRYEISKIIEVAFKNTSFCLEAERFINRFEKIKEYAEYVNALPLTLNDIFKYKILREVTYGKFDENIISLMLFAYRFIHQENIEEVCRNKEINLIDVKTHPEFIFDAERKKLFIKISENSNKGISLDIDIKYDDENKDKEKRKNKDNDKDKIAEKINNLYKKIASLTISQKHCILFLACCILSKQACIVQGATASGKTYLIRLFAEMIGKKLNVYQMSNDINISILTGQSFLSDELSDDDIKDLKDAFDLLKDIKIINDHIKNNIGDPKEWKRTTFTNLLEMIKIEINSKDSRYTEEEYEIIEKAAQKINETIQPAKRFHFEESSFIKAIKNGEWVLIDGIESSPPEFIEKISSLCGQNPELDLFELGDNYYYTRNKQTNSQQIHEGFHLFITYNPTSQIENKQLDSNFFSKSAIFTLPSIDATPGDSAQILTATLPKLYGKDNIIEISKRLAMVQSYAKEMSEKQSDLFAADNKFTGRTIKFISDEFIRYSKINKRNVNMHEPIINSIKYYYLLSYVNKDKRNDFKDALLTQFSNDINQDYFLNLKYEGIDIIDKYMDLLSDLRNIQKCANGKSELSFDFAQFVQRCLKIKINDLPLIQAHIHYTIQLIDELDFDNNYSDKKLDYQYSQLMIIDRLFDEIKKERYTLDGNDNFSLDDENLLVNEKLNQPLSRLKLLSQLILYGSKCFSLKIPRILFNEEFQSLMNTVSNLIEDNNINYFKIFVQKLNSNPNLISLIENRFPYNLFEKTHFKMINYILPMFKSLHESKITFHVVILDQMFDFVYYNQAYFEPTYIIEENEFLTLSSKSHIKTNKKDITFQNKSKNINDMTINYFFYNLSNYLIKNPYQYNFNITELNTKTLDTSSKQVSNFSLLLQDNNDTDSGIVAKSWSLLYSLTSKSISIFEKYLLPLERDVLRSFENIYNDINSSNVSKIDDYTSKMSKFRQEQNNYLWEIINNHFKMDTNILNSKEVNLKNEIRKYEEMLRKVDKEIEFLEEISEYNYGNLPIESYINLLNANAKDPIKKIIYKMKENDEHFKLMVEFDKIIKKLDDIDAKKVELMNLKNQIKKQIEKDSKDSLSNEKIKFYDSQIVRFKEYVKLNEVEYDKNNIMYPKFTSTYQIQNYSSDVNVKLYENVIWFSTINDILNNIIKSKKNDIFQNILQLNNYSDTETIVKFLINRFVRFDNSRKDFSAEDENKIRHIINASLIYKFMKDGIIDKINILPKIFDNLGNREAINSEIILDWIHKIANRYPPNFELSFPKFHPKDLLYLYIGFNDEKSKYASSILKNISINEENEIINDLKNLIPKKFSNAVECSTDICKIIYKCYKKKENSLPSDFSEIFNSMKDKSSYVKDLILLMDVAKKIDSYQTMIFTFNDIQFLDKNWLQNKKFIDKYPSLIYWLLKNEHCTSQLQYTFSDYSFSEPKETYPFWIFVIRLMSSFSCIKFDCSSKSNSAKYIQNTIQNKVISTIKNKITSSKSIGTIWLNLFLSNIPEIFSNRYCQMIRQYFLNISEDTKILDPKVIDEKNYILKTFIHNVCDLLFNDKLSSIFNVEIDSVENKDADLSFIKNPNDFILLKIKSKIQSILEDISISDEYNNLCKFCIDLHEKVNCEINELKNIVNDEIKKKNKDYEDEANRIKKIKYEKIKKTTYEDIEIYQNNYKKLLEFGSNFIDYDGFQSLSSEIISNLKKIRHIEGVIIKNDSRISLVKFNYKAPYNNYQYYRYYKPKYEYILKIMIKDQQNNSCIFEIKPNKDYYFYKWQITPEIKKYLNHLLNKLYTIEEFEISPVSKKFDIEKYCIKSIQDITAKRVSLSFSQYGNPDAFIQKIEKTTKTAVTFIKSFEDDIKNINGIKYDTFGKPAELNKQITELIKEFNVNFSDGSACQNVEKILENMKNNIFYQLIEYTNSLISKISSVQIEEICNETILNKKFKQVFDKEYRLPLPTNQKYKCPDTLFKSITNTNFFSSPILSVEKGRIVCCYDSLDCPIGPIIPSLYSSRITMNFISFIEEEFTVDIQPENKQYSKLFTAKLINSDQVQIYILLPDSIPKNGEIPTNIIFKSTKYDELKLKCNFRFIIYPLSIYISCKQYKLAFKDNSFYLCTNKLLSASRLIFTIKNFYLKDQTSFKYQIISFDDNTTYMPSIKENNSNNTLEINIPYVSKPERLHGEIKLKFSEKFMFSIIIDAAVVPFDFDFDIYDPNIKKYISSNDSYNNPNIVYYTAYNPKRDISLHLRIYNPTFFNDIKGEIQTYLPNCIEPKFNGIDKNFTIKQDERIKFFNIDLKFKHEIEGKQKSLNYSISIKMNNKSKTIYLKFETAPDDILSYYGFNISYLNKFNVYGYKSSINKWEKIQRSSSNIGYNCVVSPFSYKKTSQIMISYDFNCRIVTSDIKNKLISIDYKGNQINNENIISTPIDKYGNLKPFTTGFFYNVGKYLNDSFDFYFYPIYGVIENHWYPVYKVYPSIDWQILEVNDKNIKKAANDIKNLIENHSEKIENNSDFIQFIKLLRCNDVILRIGEIIQYLPPEIKVDFDYITANASYISKYHPKRMIILSYNAIILFSNHFQTRYNEIKRNGCYLIPNIVNQNIIDQKMEECYAEYCEVDPNIKNQELPSYEKFRKIQVNMNSIIEKTDSTFLNEKSHDAYLYNENSKPVPRKQNEESEYHSKSDYQLQSKSQVSSIPIKLPNENEELHIEHMTIPVLNDYYQFYIKTIRLFPNFVGEMIMKKSKKMEKEAIDCFSKLLKIYIDLPEKDYSIISSTTNLFSKSFVSMIGKLKKAGVDFGGILPAKCKVNSNEVFQDFFHYPEKDDFYLPPDEWYYNKERKRDDFSSVEKEWNIDDNPSDQPIQQAQTDSNKQTSKTDNSKEEKEKEKEEIARKNAEFEEMMKNISGAIIDQNNQNILNSNEKIVQDTNNDNKDLFAIMYEPEEGDDFEGKEVSKEQFDGVISEFNEKDGILRAINRMKSMEKKKDSDMKINKVNPYSMQKSNMMTSSNKFPIIQLM